MSRLKPKKLVGWRYGVFISGFVGLIGITLYPIAISPMLNPDEYKNIQKITRRNVKQEEIQPGNMKVWSDPFAKKEDPK